MLHLSRGLGENILITVPPSTEPRTITIEVIRGTHSQRWGITADKDVNVVRGEVLLRAEREQQEYAASHDGRGKECSR